MSKDPDFDIDTDIGMGISHRSIRNMICVPVLDTNGSVIAIIQSINKVERSSVRPEEQGEPLSLHMNVLKSLKLKILFTSFCFELMVIMIL